VGCNREEKLANRSADMGFMSPYTLGIRLDTEGGFLWEEGRGGTVRTLGSSLLWSKKALVPIVLKVWEGEGRLEF